MERQLILATLALIIIFEVSLSSEHVTISAASNSAASASHLPQSQP